MDKFVLTRKITSHFLNQNRSYFKRMSKLLNILSYEPKQLEPPYKHITQIGDPVLRKVADPVPEELIQSKEMNFIINEMTNALRKYSLVGIAAPQIGISLRIIIIEFSEKLKKEYSSAIYSSRQMETFPLTVFINPEIKITNYNKNTFPEGCGSVKGYKADVDRYEEVMIDGFTVKGEKQNLVLKGWNARIAQHEMDHLNGIIYVDIMNSKTFTCTCWESVNSSGGKIELPFYK